MFSDNLSIKVENLGKRYSIYAKPQDRLRQAITGRLRSAIGATPRSYSQDFWALRDVNFDVHRGETVGIIGRNGSGKSTLLQIISGTVTPTTGTVQTRGRVAALLELGAGFNPEFTGRENVYLNASLLGLTRPEVDDRFADIAAFAGIGDFIESPVKKYSSGMFARLAFSVAVHTEPDILIVDEILAVGDAAFQRKCMQKFYDIRKNGCTVLFVSHDQYQVKSICERALYLEHGVQKVFGTAGPVIDTYVIDTQKTIAEEESQQAASSSAPTERANEPDRLYAITHVELRNEDGRAVNEVATGETIELAVEYESTSIHPPSEISFVFNLYRHDGLYISGSTTVIDGLQPQPGVHRGRFRARFPRLPLLSGSYKWRVAINDIGGFVVHAEANDVCDFRVIDKFQSVGLINLDRQWHFEPEYIGHKKD